MSDRTANRVIAVIAESLFVSPDAISPESTFKELDIDSLTGLNLIYEMEKAFGVDVPVEQVLVILACGRSSIASSPWWGWRTRPVVIRQGARDEQSPRRRHWRGDHLCPGAQRGSVLGRRIVGTARLCPISRRSKPLPAAARRTGPRSADSTLWTTSKSNSTCSTDSRSSPLSPPREAVADANVFWTDQDRERSAIVTGSCIRRTDD